MSRFNYNEDDDRWGLWEQIRYRSIQGRPGKAMLLSLERALKLLPIKSLVEGLLCNGEGVCAIGAMGYRKFIDEGMEPKKAWNKMKKLSYSKPIIDDDSGHLTLEFAVNELGMTRALACIIADKNDSIFYYYKDSNEETGKRRYNRMLSWVKTELGRSSL